jgi:hypothetical protein
LFIKLEFILSKDVAVSSLGGRGSRPSVNAALSGLPLISRWMKHDPEKACPGFDPEWTPMFGVDHAPTQF